MQVLVWIWLHGFHVWHQRPPGPGGCVATREITYDYATTRIECPENPCGGGVGYTSLRSLRRSSVDRLDYEDDAVRGRIHLRALIEDRRQAFARCFEGFGTYQVGVEIAIVEGHLLARSITGVPYAAAGACVVDQLRAIPLPRVTIAGAITVHLRFVGEDPRVVAAEPFSE